jgi:hypothetical protein
MRNYLKITCFSFLLLFAASPSFAAVSLLANTVYTVEVSQMNSDGTTTLSSSSSATSDANSKITFTFSNVPTFPTVNFLIVTVKDSAGTVVTKSFAAAPPAGGTSSLGVNTSSSAQAAVLEAMGVLMGSDDPICMAFGLMMTRSAGMTAQDLIDFSVVGQQAVIIGMEGYMTDSTKGGLSTATLDLFKAALISNSAAGTQDLRAFSSLYKSAIDTPASADADMAKASGLVADIFIDAAATAGIDLNIILAALDYVDIVMTPGSAGANSMTSLQANALPFFNTMQASMEGFKTRLKVFKVKQTYSDVLTELGSTTVQITKFNDGVTALSTAFSAIDTLYAPCFDGTTALDVNTATINTGNACVAVDINQAYGTAFDGFSAAIASSDADILSLRESLSVVLNTTVTNLINWGVGGYQDYNGKTINWPIPQSASVSFIGAALTNGGSLSYARTGQAIPAAMGEWMGSCSDSTKNNRTSCAAPEVWTSLANNFNNGNTSMDCMQGIQEDIMIAQNTYRHGCNS